MKMPLPQEFSISTSKCKLRFISESDFPYVFTAAQHPGFTAGMLWEAPTSIEELYEPYRKAVEAWECGHSYSFGIDSVASGNFIGKISIRKTEQSDIWNIGFWTHPSQQKKGYMSEASKAIVQLGFERLDAKRIEACHALWNVASQKILEKVGMSFVRYIPEGFCKQGVWVPENLMAIERKHWRSLRTKS